MESIFAVKILLISEEIIVRLDMLSTPMTFHLDLPLVHVSLLSGKQLSDYTSPLDRLNSSLCVENPSRSPAHRTQKNLKMAPFSNAISDGIIDRTTKRFEEVKMQKYACYEG